MKYMAWSKLMSKIFHLPLRTALASVLRDGGDLDPSTRVTRPSGKVRDVILRSVCEPAENGHANRMFGTCLDVTDLSKTESRLRASENQFRLFVDSVGDYAIYTLDPNGVVSDWNTGAERIKGYGRNEVVGRNFSMFYTADDRARGAPEAALANARKDGTFVGEGWRVRKDGSRFRCSVVLSAMRDDRGLLIGFAKITRDITDRNAIEEDLRAKTMLLDQTMANMDQGLLMVDRVGVVRVFNARASELLGLPMALLSSKPTLAQVLQFQQERGEFRNEDPAFVAGILTGAVRHESWTFERERPNGTIVEIRIVPLADGGSVRTFTDITMRKKAERRAEHLAMHDALTALPNRRGFHERLSRKLRAVVETGGACAVLCIDLDRFKTVNDTFGHPMGDHLLKTVAERLRSVLRVDDVAARIGGDEFAILIDTPRERSIDAVARRLVEVVSAPYDLNGVDVSVGISIGVAIAPTDGSDLEQLIRNADAALYRTKASGRNAYCFYDPAIARINDDRLILEVELAQAVRYGRFELHYQPIVDAASRQIVCFEALIRWRHPKRGLIAPDVFIPLAEETGMIVPIGEWALREACRTAADWPCSVGVAVNVSAIQFRKDRFEQHVEAALTSSGLAPGRLELEITESVLMQEGDGCISCMTRLRETGIRIALDDFGTGYSSLSCLHRVPIDKIKIDKSFVQRVGEPYADDIVKAIVTLGKMRGSVITAEGVETQEQHDWMVSAGCDQIQGYLISKPMPANIATRACLKNDTID